MRETNGGSSAADAGERTGEELADSGLARNGGDQGALPMTDHTAELDGLPIFWRRAPQPGNGPVPLYIHGVPSSADEWGAPPRPVRRRRTRRGRRRAEAQLAAAPAPAVPFLARSGGLAPDLPGFGRSGKGGDRRYTIGEYERFIEAFLDLVEVDQVQLVLHDWGAVGLAFAQRHPERVRSLVLIDVIPFLPGYRWHRIARLWRTPLLGELAMGFTTRTVLRAVTRESNVTPGPLPEAWRDSVYEHLDQGTQRAILRLYRSSPSDVLAAAGEQLATLTAPALVLWGAADPYIPVRFAHEYASTLPNAELEILEDAGHWPWLDRPDTIDRVCSFLAAH